MRSRRAVITALLLFIGLGAAASPGAAQAPEDKALGRPAVASSVEGVRPGGQCSELLCPPGNATDGRADTRWSSEYTDTEWWQVDLGSPRQVDTVALTWHVSRAQRYVIATSIDGINFASAAHVIMGLSAEQLAELIASRRHTETTRFEARAARYVRVTSLERAPIYRDGLTLRFGVSLWTASVFGPADPAPPGAGTPSPSGTPPSAFADRDGDGVSPPFDCDDTNPEKFRGAPEIPRDGVDQDCSGRDARFPLLDRHIAGYFLTFQRYSMFTALAVLPVRAGDRLRLTCRGPGCPLRRRSVRVGERKSRLSLLRLMRGARLRRGAVVQLRVTRPGMIGRVARWKILAPKTVKSTRACLRPGAKKPGRCPF